MFPRRKCLHTLVDWDSVRNTIPEIQNDPRVSPGRVQGQDGLVGNVHRGCVEGLEHDLGHLRPVLFWIEWTFSQKYWVLI